jgi:hypothetical protein
LVFCWWRWKDGLMLPLQNQLGWDLMTETRRHTL